MSILGGLGDLFGEVTGFGGNGNPNPHSMDPTAYADLYNDALGQIQAVGAGDPTSIGMRKKIENAAMGQLDDLQNNAAGRKKNFEQDMARSYGADVQSMARAKGGTGGLANAMHNAGNLYDAQARGLSRGYNDLYSQAINDLGNIQGTQQNLFNQDFNKAQAAAGLRMNEMGQRRGYGAQGLENQFNSEQAGRQRRMNTLGTIAKGAGAYFGGGTGGS